MIHDIQKEAWYERDDHNVSYVVDIFEDKQWSMQVVKSIVYDQKGKPIYAMFQQMELNLFRHSHTRRVKPRSRK